MQLLCKVHFHIYAFIIQNTLKCQLLKKSSIFPVSKKDFTITILTVFFYQKYPL